jgi:O-antigen ligase
VMTLTRSAWLGFGVGLAALFLASRPRLLILVPVLAGALVAAGPEAVTRRALSMFDRADATARDRIVMWEAGVAMVKDHPLTGVGPGRVKELYPEYRRPGFVEPRPGHLHNNLIMIAAETGLPSLGAYLWFLVAFLRGAAPFARGPWTRVQAVARGSVAAMVALFVAGLFEYNFGDVEILRVTLLLSVFPFVALAACGLSDAPAEAGGVS